MPGARKRGERIREYILQNVRNHSRDITAMAAKEFGISRQAINHHIRRLVDDKVLNVKGTRSRPNYELRRLLQEEYNFKIDASLEEDVVWKTSIAQHFNGAPKNVFDIWEYGFTEMLNNAIDHSEGKAIDIYIDKFKNYLEIFICDDGVGIFKKIKDALDLDDERHSVLELAKGKFTTDPDNHSGEGIFFSSRVFDHFGILSGDVYYAHDYGDTDEWIAELLKPSKGTLVCMGLQDECDRTLSSVLDEYAEPDSYAFSKTKVPVDLARYGDDTLISRSQAKRMLTRIDRFTTVLFDFENVDSVGQSFADEVFRVFANRHPEIELSFINANKKIQRMISRARAQR